MQVAERGDIGAPAFTIVTTFGSNEWRAYARRMVETVAENLDPAIRFLVVFEGERPTGLPPDTVVVGISELVPDLPRILARDRAVPQRRGIIQGKYDYRADAVRFCRKPLVCLAARQLYMAGSLIWLDADCVAHGSITPAWLRKALPETCDISFLGRLNAYSECGFLGFNQTPASFEVLRRWAGLYRDGDIFKLPQWHDSWAFDYVRGDMTKVSPGAEWQNRRVATLRQHDLGHGSGTPGTHVFINSMLGERLDHLKGPRKQAGRSHATDLMRPRKEPYWREDRQ